MFTVCLPLFRDIPIRPFSSMRDFTPKGILGDDYGLPRFDFSVVQLDLKEMAPSQPSESDENWTIAFQISYHSRVRFRVFDKIFS